MDTWIWIWSVAVAVLIGAVGGYAFCWSGVRCNCRMNSTRSFGVRTFNGQSGGHGLTTSDELDRRPPRRTYPGGESGYRGFDGRRGGHGEGGGGG